MSERDLEASAEAAGRRLDVFAAQGWPDLSRSRLQGLIREGHVLVDGEPVRDPSARLRAGSRLRLHVPPAVEAAPRPEAIPLAIVWEDPDLIVIEKPAGLVVHPGAGHEDGTLVNALLGHCAESLSGIGGVKRPGIVHRLDKDTSGLLVVAKSDRAHHGLAAQFADHGRTGPLRREYLAFAWGVPDPPRGRIEAALARAANHREKMAVVSEERGRRAVTHFAVAEAFGPEPGPGAASLLRCRLETGRTHQIRVHLAHKRHPLVGDDLYGAGYRTKAALLPAAARAEIAALGRQALHAATLGFAHPVTGEELLFESALPEDLVRLLTALRLPPETGDRRA